MRKSLILLLTVLPVPALAQGVLVAPHAVFIDHRTRSGWVQLYNPGTDPVEVSIEALFGYPITDSAGHLELRTIEKPDSTVPSAVEWIQAFPRRAVIPAQTRQTVRLLITPPAGHRGRRVLGPPRDHGEGKRGAPHRGGHHPGDHGRPQSRGAHDHSPGLSQGRAGDGTGDLRPPCDGRR